MLVCVTNKTFRAYRCDELRIERNHIFHCDKVAEESETKHPIGWRKGVEKEFEGARKNYSR